MLAFFQRQKNRRCLFSIVYAYGKNSYGNGRKNPDLGKSYQFLE